MRRPLHALLVLAAVAALGPLAGCVAEVPSRAIGDWELDVDGARDRVHLPGHLGHGLDDHEAVYRLRTRVTLDPAWRGQALVLGVPILRTRLELRANGRPVPYLDDHLLDRERIMSAHRFRIDGALTDVDALELEVTVHHTIAESSWWNEAPVLAVGPYGDRWTRIVNAWNTGTAWISLIALVTLSLVFWMMHATAFLRRAHGTDSDRKNVEFSKLAAGGALYAAVQVGLLQPLLGRRDLGLIGVSLLVSIKASVQLVRRYVGVSPLPRWTWWAMFFLTPTLVLVSGRFLQRGWVALMVAAIVGVIAYVAGVTFAKAPAGARADLAWVVFTWCFVAVLASADVVKALGWGSLTGGLELTCFGLLVFVLSQAYMLSRDHTALLVDQAKLNRELARRVGEVEVLNEELRRKVGDRSRELSAALRKLRADGDGELPSGAVLGDHYRVVGRLGAGAMGAVYRVERLTDGRSLAAKVVRGRVRPDTLERFTREAELTARVDHPNVVRVLDVDVTSDGELFLVMELVDGRSLEDERARYRDPGFAERVTTQIAEALAAIHAAGIVHRDLKPSNVLVSLGADGVQVKVADFGIAGFGVGAAPPKISVGPIGGADGAALDATIDAPAQTPSDPKLTETGAIMGTPLYMAPEVLQGTATIGAAADLFSLGLIAYQLFGGPRIEREGWGFRKKSLARFADFAPGLSAALADALQRCLHQDPTRRPSAAELVALLNEAAARAAG